MTTRLGLARPTARQAIQELVRKGLLVRKRGVGTQVVAAPPIRRDVKFSSLHDDLASTGHEPSTELLERSAGTAAELGVDDVVEVDERLVHLRRLRRADGDPLAIMTNYLPDRFRLEEEELRERGLYATLRAQGVTFAIAHQTIGARLVTSEEAALLGETEPAACVTMQRLVYDDTGRLRRARAPHLPRVAVHGADLAGDLTRRSGLRPPRPGAARRATPRSWCAAPAPGRRRGGRGSG